MASRNDCDDGGPRNSADNSNLDLLVLSCDNSVFMPDPCQLAAENDNIDSHRLANNDTYEPDNDQFNSCRPVGNKNSDSHCTSSDCDHTDPYYRSADIDNTHNDESVDNRNTDFYCKSSDSYNTDPNKSADNGNLDPSNSVNHDDDEYESIDSDNDAYESVDNDKAPADTNHSVSLTSRGRNSSIEDFRQEQAAPPTLNDGGKMHLLEHYKQQYCCIRLMLSSMYKNLAISTMLFSALHETLNNIKLV